MFEQLAQYSDFIYGFFPQVGTYLFEFLGNQAGPLVIALSAFALGAVFATVMDANISAPGAEEVEDHSNPEKLSKSKTFQLLGSPEHKGWVVGITPRGKIVIQQDYNVITIMAMSNNPSVYYVRGDIIASIGPDGKVIKAAPDGTLYQILADYSIKVTEKEQGVVEMIPKRKPSLLG